MSERQTTLNDELAKYTEANGIWGYIPKIDLDLNTLGAFGSLPVGITIPNYRKLLGIISRMAKNRMELNVESVLQYIGKQGGKARKWVVVDKAIIQFGLDDFFARGLTEDELAFVSEYRGLNPTTDLTNYELAYAHKNGWVINKETGRLNVAGKETLDFTFELLPKEIRTEAINWQMEFTYTNHPDILKLVDDLKLVRRQHAEARANLEAKQRSGADVTQAEIDAVNRIGNQVCQFSETIAEMTLDRFLTGQGFAKVYPAEGMASSGAGDVDRVFAKEVDGRIQIFEVKGGASKPGSRLVTDVANVKPNSRAQQGTRPYLQQVIETMKKSKNPETSRMGRRLFEAIRKNKIDYLYFRQEFDAVGDLKPMTLEQFDIRNKNPKPNEKKK